MRKKAFVPRPWIIASCVAGIGVAAILLAWRFLPADRSPSPVEPPAATAAPGIPDGSLIKTADDPRVYYIEGGKKRVIDSEQAFLAQGFEWNAISIVDAGQLMLYPDGLPITTTSFLGLPNARHLMPDLAPVAPYELRFAVEGGRTRLRFTASFWNRGTGAFEMRTHIPEGTELTTDADYEASQRVYQAGGSFIERPVGTFFWHQIHEHYHFDDFGEYALKLIRPTSGEGTQTVLNQKTTFCLRDDQSIGAPIEGTRQARKYTGCRGNFQGVSVGWADVYRYTLADQYFDMTGMPAGIYEMTFDVDPKEVFTESRRDNNKSVTLVELNPTTRVLKVLATSSPYEAGTNSFPNGMLVQGQGDSKVYVMRANKKRWIPNEDVFRSYGFSWGAIYTLPARNVEVIPNDRLIRLSGASAVYALNDAGYKRRILSPGVMSSYGWTGADIADVNQTEFSAYPETDLIRREGDSRVFSISQRTYVGQIGSLPFGLDEKSVHVVNQTDFNAYAVQVVTTGLVIPWDIAFLPDGDMLVTERTGTVRRVGKSPAAMPIPNVLTAGEGGLMGIALDPAFAQNNYVYLYFTTDAGGRKNRVVRYRLEGNSLVQDRIILDNIPSATYHDGGQIAFGPDGKLYVATGDAQQPNLAQDTNSIAGKILRLNPDGSVPSDNPFGNLVWSYGHRNPQGLAWDSAGRLYAAEHGPTGEFGLCCRDELNRIEKGGNYGWPVITGEQTREGMIAPLLQSGASDTWAPSSAAVMGNSIFMAGLRGSSLFQVQLDDSGKPRAFRSFLKDMFGRLRGAVVGPDGFLYITTSNRDGRGTPRTGDDRIIRVHPDFF